MARHVKPRVRIIPEPGTRFPLSLALPFAGFVFHDRTGQGGQTETSLALHEFPGPDDLWAPYRRWKGLDEQAEKIVLVHV